MKAELERCEREIAAMRGQENAPAWLVALGQMDWEREKAEIIRMSGRADIQSVELLSNQ